jgi:hypothetical protein
MIKTIVLCLLLLTVPSFAQTIYPDGSKTIGWDVVAVPSGQTGTIKYKIFKRSDTVSLGMYANQEVATNSALVVMTPGVTEFIGVETQFYPTATPTVPRVSPTKAWSNIAADCLGGNMFGFLYLPTPSKPTGIRISILEMLRRYTNG